MSLNARIKFSRTGVFNPVRQLKQFFKQDLRGGLVKETEAELVSWELEDW